MDWQCKTCYYKYIMTLYATHKLLQKITKEKSVEWIFKSDGIDFLNITKKKKINLHASSCNLLCT